MRISSCSFAISVSLEGLVCEPHTRKETTKRLGYSTVLYSTVHVTVSSLDLAARAHARVPTIRLAT